MNEYPGHLPQNASRRKTQVPKGNKRKTNPPQKACRRVDGPGKIFFVTNKMLKEMRMLQNTVKSMIPVAPFVRIVKELLFLNGGQDIRIQKQALAGLQEATEMYITQFLEDSYLASLHANRVTLQVKDLRLTRRIRGVDDIINH